MGHLAYTDLGGKADESVLDQTGDTALEIANLALFSNVQSADYWSGTEFAPAPSRRVELRRRQRLPGPQ